MTSRKKPGVAFWATVGLVGLVLYVLSFGPAIWLVAHDRLPTKPTSIVFRPLLIEAIREIPNWPPGGRSPVLWWASVWDSPSLCDSLVGSTMHGLAMLLDEIK